MFTVCWLSRRGGYRGAGGGGGGRTPFSSGIRPPADPRGPPFDTFSEIHFWPTDPKFFLKAPLAPIYTNFEGERAPKKRDFFLSKFFKKCPKTAFLSKIRANQCFGRARKINLVDLKKGRQNFGNFFWKSAPPPPPPSRKT